MACRLHLVTGLPHSLWWAVADVARAQQTHRSAFFRARALILAEILADIHGMPPGEAEMPRTAFATNAATPVAGWKLRCHCAPCEPGRAGSIAGRRRGRVFDALLVFNSCGMARRGEKPHDDLFHIGGSTPLPDHRRNVTEVPARQPTVVCPVREAQGQGDTSGRLTAPLGQVFDHKDTRQ